MARKLRNSPVVTRRARRGFTPQPGHVSINFPVDYAAPIKTHIVANGVSRDKRAE